MSKKMPTAKYLFDLYGVIEMLSSSGNKLLDDFANGLASGSIKVMSKVSGELKDTYPDLYKKFQAIKSGRVYQPTTAAHSSIQQALIEKYGTGWFGGSPMPEHFESVAVCRAEKLKLVSGGKALGHCKSIAKKCSLNGLGVLSVQDFSNED